MALGKRTIVAADSVGQMVRVIMEVKNRDSFSIRVSDLSKLRARIGQEVFDCFYRCFIQADRLTSLVSFAYLSMDRFGKDSIAYKRDGLTGIWFITGTLKELGLDLGDLRAALVKAGRWDKASWGQTLQKWENWSNTPSVSALRNEAAFHLDRDRLTVGIGKASDQDVFIYKSDTLNNRDGWFENATEVLLAGLQTQISAKQIQIDLEFIIKNMGDYLAFGHSLADEFIRVMKTVGVKPIIVTTKGGKAIASLSTQKKSATPTKKQTNKKPTK